MSDRHERIDRAIDDLVVACLETADTLDDEPGAVARILAEQWLRAAIYAEPTEAEIAAAMEAFAFEYPLRGLCEDMGWHPSFEAAMYAGLTAFLAARKARP